MGKKAEKVKPEGIDEEIEMLRGMIRKVVSNVKGKTSLADQIKQLDAISSATLALSRSLKVKSELEESQGSSAELLREALLELEEEWPEFKKLVSKYYPAKPETDKE